MASGRRNFMEQQAGREQKYESGKKNHLWDHGRNPVHGGTGERIRDDEGRDMEKGYKKSDHGNTADAAGADAVHRPGDHGSVRNPHGGIHGGP
mgnify:CR=1 FL=1